MKKVCFVSGFLYIAFSSITSSSSLEINALKETWTNFKTKFELVLPDKKYQRSQFIVFIVTVL